MADIVQHPSSKFTRNPLGHTVRTGESSYRQLEKLYAEGRLPVSSVVIDASKASEQKEFINNLRKDGVEVILDTKCAELSSIGRYEGAAKGAPWSPKEDKRPLLAADFAAGSNNSVFAPIATFAIQLSVNAIHSPTHYLQMGALDPLLDIDIASLKLMRQRLDSEGSHDISIDYALLMPNRLIQDETHLRLLIQKLSGLPFDNLVIRLSNFGSDISGPKMNNTFKALECLSALNKPIVIDHIGGIVGLAAVALGYASGTVHGIGERERFAANDWLQPRTPTKFGRPGYFPFPGLDRSFKRQEINAILNAPNGRRHLLCEDRKCCGSKGLSYLENPKAHIAYQANRSLEMLNEVPNLHRAAHFLDNEMTSAIRKAQKTRSLRTGNESLDRRLVKAGDRIDSLARTCENLLDQQNGGAQMQPIVRRGKYQGDS